MRPEEPPGDALQRVWAQPRGLRIFSEVNNTTIGLFYIATGFGFFLAGGILALLIRVQLAWPGLGFLSQETYNQVFTMHGTTMMFLFAVPIMEGFAVYLLPQFLGARDLPFPRLSAYGYWCYLLGGLLIYTSFLFGEAPDSGWFMYTPLSSGAFTPGRGPDFWLLGVSFIEISAISAAIEIIVGVMKTRAPGMSLDRMPLLAWYFLVVAVMIVFAFPPILVGDVLLELERAFDIPYFDPTRGGDVLLWQHLFWIFGHPEVYIIFLPAAGMVSTMLPTFARRPLAAYEWVVLAAVATGFISFGLWVHHMYTAGIPQLSLAFFSAASMAVAVPSGIQVFAWIATMWRRRPALTVPMLFILGFLFIFVMGGLTGVMVASVPFDWQVHDTHFVVAHFHYVLVGGAVFPLFAGLYYWTPLATGRLMSVALGRLAFALMFVGFNLNFFPLHLAGLLGMPRRVWTYPAGLGWEAPNLVASVGAAILGAGVLVYMLDFLWHLRAGRKAGTNPWGAGTLEWAGPTPLGPASPPSVPPVASRNPLWDEPATFDAAGRGEYYLARPATGGRETMRTEPVTATPQQVIALPGPSWIPFTAALTTAVFFAAALFKAYALALAGALATLVIFLPWFWSLDRKPAATEVDVGRGLVLPTYDGTSHSHAWWALFVAILVDLSAYASLIFAWFFLWAGAEEWPPMGLAIPDLRVEAGIGAALLLASLGAVRFAVRGVARPWRLSAGFLAGMALALAFALRLAAALASAPVPPQEHAYIAMVWAIAGYLIGHVAIVAGMAAFVLLRAALGLVDAERKLAPRLVLLAWQAATGIGLVGLAVLALTPLVD